MDLWNHLPPNKHELCPFGGSQMLSHFIMELNSFSLSLINSNSQVNKNTHIGKLINNQNWASTKHIWILISLRVKVKCAGTDSYVQNKSNSKGYRCFELAGPIHKIWLRSGASFARHFHSCTLSFVNLYPLHANLAWLIDFFNLSLRLDLQIDDSLHLFHACLLVLSLINLHTITSLKLTLRERLK